MATGLLAGVGYATPSTTYWTPVTTDIQPYRNLHIGIDDYFTIFKKGVNKGSFPTDAGLTLGVLPFNKVQAEVGVDFMEPQDDPFMFNAKIGTPEDIWFKGSPALNVGIFNVGTKRDVTDFNIVDVIIGKTINGEWKWTTQLDVNIPF